ncbi:MAG: PQQ-dependent sugar dehydrogenase [Chloroflexi bacterium]|nr:PQQ-dependent sugar dehydrogenase [Chloroflexota bacterium]
MMQRLLSLLAPLIASLFGLSLLFFAAAWMLAAVYRFGKKRARVSGVLVFVTALAGTGIFLYLTASTAARRAYINLPMRELAIGVGLIAASAIVAAALAFGVYKLAERLGGNSDLRFGLTASFSIAVLFAVVGYGLYLTTFTPDLDEVSVVATPIEKIVVADNIPIQVFENAVVQQPTALEIGPDNELYVAGIGGSIWIMRDDDLNGAADSVAEFASGLKQPEGLAWSEAGLYVTEIDKLVLLKDTNGDGVADESQVIVDGFPGEEYAFHQSNGLTFGPDGRLYIGVGSTTDHRPETHPLAARILSVNPDGSDLKVYATGLRNPFGIIPAPGGGFFAIDNGSSGCIDTATQVDDCSNKIDVPEELNYIVEGKDYGFPNYFGIPPQDSGTQPPVVTFVDHSAPAGIDFYAGDAFPTKYKGQLFVSLWARNEIHSVRVFRIDSEHFVGASRLFISGILGPSALLNSPDGGLYVASFSSNTIYHIGPVANEAVPAASATPAPLLPGDATKGQALFAATCSACHGPTGEGVPSLGKDLTTSEWVAGKSDKELVEFIKVGRPENDPRNTTGVTMPPNGGNPALSEQDLYNIVAYLREIQK